MTKEVRKPPDDLRGCLGLPVEQALALCAQRGLCPAIVYTGERAADACLTPRVIALRENTLVAARFRDGDPRGEET